MQMSPFFDTLRATPAQHANWAPYFISFACWAAYNRGPKITQLQPNYLSSIPPARPRHRRAPVTAALAQLQPNDASLARRRHRRAAPRSRTRNLRTRPMPGRRVAVMPGRRGAVEPGRRGTVEPARRGAVEPGVGARWSRAVGGEGGRGRRWRRGVGGEGGRVGAWWPRPASEEREAAR